MASARLICSGSTLRAREVGRLKSGTRARNSQSGCRGKLTHTGRPPSTMEAVSPPWKAGARLSG